MWIELKPRELDSQQMTFEDFTSSDPSSSLEALIESDDELNHVPLFTCRQIHVITDEITSRSSTRGRMKKVVDNRGGRGPATGQ